MTTSLDQRPRSWFKTELVQRHISLASKQVAVDAAASFVDSMECRHNPELFGMGGTQDSPLEVVWEIWWETCRLANDYYGRAFSLESQVDVEVSRQWYRLDYVVTLVDDRLMKAMDEAALSWPKVGIELDGHAFHEKTLDQVTRRNQRDRALQQDGWRVFHYSFEEMNTRPRDCAAEVFVFARDAYQALNDQAYRARMTPERTAEREKLLLAAGKLSSVV